MRHPQLATRLFGVPLLIERHKLEVILAAMAPRFAMAQDEEAQLFGPGDTGKSRKDYYVTEERVAVIDIVGPLVKRASGDFLSGGPTTYGQIESEFMDAVTDPEIAGIMLQLDSPGGESTGCFELAQLIYSQRGAKPVIAAVDGDAYSAAYALASAADQVYLLPSGGVGSIGVWMMHQDWSGANEKAGVKPTYIFAGARKIDGNPDNPLSADALKVFEAIVARTYGMFVDCVARNRGLAANAVRETEAALYFGPESLSAGLADKLGTFSDAMAAMRDRVAGKSSVARSAAKSTNRRNMEHPDAAADTTDPQPEDCPTCNGTGKLDGMDCPDCGGTGKMASKPAEAAAPVGATFAHATAIVEMCALAGLSARASLAFLRPDAAIETLRAEILEARAVSADQNINSHILPNAGATAGKGSESPLVKAAEGAAAAARKER